MFKENIKKTAVITPFDLHIFPCSPCTPKNAGQNFQPPMDKILEDIPHTFLHLDDILIPLKEEHMADLKRVFKTLDEVYPGGLFSSQDYLLLFSHG